MLALNRSLLNKEYTLINILKALALSNCVAPFFPLITPLHGPIRKYRFQQEFYCCVLIRCSGSTFTNRCLETGCITLLFIRLSRGHCITAAVHATILYPIRVKFSEIFSYLYFFFRSVMYCTPYTVTLRCPMRIIMSTSSSPLFYCLYNI
jgi:hypothetical protein